MIFNLGIHPLLNTGKNANNGTGKQLYTKLYSIFFSIILHKVASKNITPVKCLIEIMNIICNNPGCTLTYLK